MRLGLFTVDVSFHAAWSQSLTTCVGTFVIEGFTRQPPKIYLTTTTQQNEEKDSIIAIYNLVIVILEVFRIFQALWKTGNFLVFLRGRLRGVGGCRVIPSSAGMLHTTNCNNGRIEGVFESRLIIAVVWHGGENRKALISSSGDFPNQDSWKTTPTNAIYFYVLLNTRTQSKLKIFTWKELELRLRLPT